ncbi:MAG TPA: glycosyltransferase [Steroidobacteraceae bacterium]|nr:glycosyltransferase [Steroidobacteraceae bacterium]
MKILWIKSELLHPVDKGGRIRTYQMLRAMRRKHHVRYLCLDDGTAAAEAKTLASEYANEVFTVPFKPPSKGGMRFYGALVANLFSRSPYALARYRSHSLRAHVARLAADVDLVVCDFLAPAESVPDRLKARTVLFQHNVEAKIWERHVSAATNPIKRAYLRTQWHKMLRSERAQCLRFDHIVAVSDTDANTMRRDYGTRSVSYVATGVDLEYFRPRQERKHGGGRIVFVGSMDWMPNEDGIRWFLVEVLPRVRDTQGNAKLIVVGRSPSAGLRELAARSSVLEVTGTVPDVRPYLEDAALSIVPLRIGGGTRLKIYEAMAMRVPVVSTSIGAEGLPLRHGEHLLLADTAQEFANAITGLLGDPAMGDRLAHAAASHVEDNCGWDSVAEQFLEQCLASPCPPNSSVQDRTESISRV